MSAAGTNPVDRALLAGASLAVVALLALVSVAGSKDAGHAPDPASDEVGGEEEAAEVGGEEEAAEVGGEEVGDADAGGAAAGEPGLPPPPAPEQQSPWAHPRYEPNPLW